MNLKLLILSTTFFSCLSGLTFALTCPDKASAPKCPTSGSTLLDETYPTQAFVISNSPMNSNVNSRNVTSEFVTAVIKSYNLKNVPQVIIPVRSEDEYLEIINQVKNNLQKNHLKENEIDEIIKQISHAKTENYTWQQDYFESFVDLNTGNPVLREFQSYVYNPQRFQTFNSVKKISGAGKDCSISEGQILPNYKQPSYLDNPREFSFASGEMGGNVEGAPGGLCLIGDNQSKKLAKYYCGKIENIVQLNTSWLHVGHVDEIFKIIPTNVADGRPKECQFSLMAASPSKALELMKSKKNEQKAFFEFNSDLNEDELKQTRESRSNNITTGNEIICNFVKKSKLENKLLQRANEKNYFNNSKSVLIKILFPNLIAQSETDNDNFKCFENLELIPTSVMLEKFESFENLKNLNQAIQDSINSDKELIKNQILSRLPQCAKYYDELDVPNLFYGADPIEGKDGKYILPKDYVYGGSVDSFFPNPTNSVLMNKSILLPDSGSSIFNDYVVEELAKRKLDTVKIDSWDYAHVGNGNIHCSSHSILYCNPNKE